MAVQTVKVVREEGGGCGEEIEQHFESLRFEAECANPMSTALTRLDLSFSATNHKALRSLLLRPSSPPLLSTLVPSPSANSVKLFPVFPHLHISTPSAMLDASFSNSRFSLIPPIPSSPLYSPSKSSLSPESFSLRTPIPAFHLDQACHLGPPLEREISRDAQIEVQEVMGRKIIVWSTSLLRSRTIN